MVGHQADAAEKPESTISSALDSCMHAATDRWLMMPSSPRGLEDDSSRSWPRSCAADRRGRRQRIAPRVVMALMKVDLPAAVGTEDGDVLGGIDAQGDVAQGQALAAHDGDVAEFDQGRGCSGIPFQDGRAGMPKGNWGTLHLNAGCVDTQAR